MHPCQYVATSYRDKRLFKHHDECYDDDPDWYSPPDQQRVSGRRVPHQVKVTMPSEVPIDPHDHDVLLGRGGRNNQHTGNEILRQFARVQGDKYKVSSKKGKSALSRLLVKQMHELNPPGRFLRRVQQTAQWEEVGDDTAREKASQVLRDAVAGLLEKKDIPVSAQTLRTVSSQASSDDQDLSTPPTHASAPTSRSTFPDPPRDRPPTPKRRRYATEYYRPPYNESYHLAQGVDYSPIRRHSEGAPPDRVRSSTSSRRSAPNPSYASSSRSRESQWRAGHSAQNSDSMGELMSGELLDSDIEDDEPIPHNPHSGMF